MGTPLGAGWVKPGRSGAGSVNKESELVKPADMKGHDGRFARSSRAEVEGRYAYLDDSLKEVQITTVRYVADRLLTEKNVVDSAPPHAGEREPVGR